MTILKLVRKSRVVLPGSAPILFLPLFTGLNDLLYLNPALSSVPRYMDLCNQLTYAYEQGKNVVFLINGYCLFMPAVVSATAAGHCSCRSGNSIVARLFIVEDHPAVLSAYKFLLKRERDRHVIGAIASGKEALTLIPQYAPDLIILDMMLPGINGLVVSQHLHQLLPRLPILMVSSYERTLSTLR